MSSLYDELAGKLEKDPRKTSVVRFDLSLLMFNARSGVRDLWTAADRHLRSHPEEDDAGLRAAVDALRPIFGEREQRTGGEGS